MPANAPLADIAARYRAGIESLRQNYQLTQDEQDQIAGLAQAGVVLARTYPYNPIFQVNFRATQGRAEHLLLAGAVTRPLDLDPGYAKFDLALELHADDHGLIRTAY